MYFTKIENFCLTFMARSQLKLLFKSSKINYINYVEGPCMGLSHWE